MPLTDKQKANWRRTLVVTASLLALGAVVTFVPIYWVRNFNKIAFFGWPMGFYLCAQGAIICCVFIVWLYANLMEKLDGEFGMDERHSGTLLP